MIAPFKRPAPKHLLMAKLERERRATRGTEIRRRDSPLQWAKTTFIGKTRTGSPGEEGGGGRALMLKAEPSTRLRNYFSFGMPQPMIGKA